MVPLPPPSLLSARVSVDVAWKWDWYWVLRLGFGIGIGIGDWNQSSAWLSRHVVEANKAGKLAKCV